MKKYVYLFEEGSAEMINVLGGKGANLAEMMRLNIPVPFGFTISTEACVYFIRYGKYPRGLKKQILSALRHVESKMGKNLGDNKNPLLLSVRSGARQSMPGMMETVLNIGLNDSSLVGLIQQTKNKRFAYDSYRRLMTMYADVVMEKSNDLNIGIRHILDTFLGKIKREKNIRNDSDLSDLDLQFICSNFKKIIQRKLKKPFPINPKEQLWESINAVFKSWNGVRAKNYRKIENIPNDWGTAVNVQVMVFGNMGTSSATGVAFTKNPSTGEDVFFGEWLPNAQGEDVVAGIRTPYPIGGVNKNSLSKKMPKIYKKLYSIQKKLESHYLDMQDIEFTVENNKLWLLQTRTGKRNGPAAIKIVLDFINKNKINHSTGLSRISSNHINELLLPSINPVDEKQNNHIALGLPAGPGAACGQIVFDANVAETLYKKGHKIILVRDETSPEDIHGMFAAEGILTSRGGMTSHAALVARGWGKCCIVGAKDISINLKEKTCLINDHIYKEMDWLTLNGSLGKVYNKKLKLSNISLNKNKDFNSLMKLCKQYNNMKVRVNADNKQDVNQAKKMGAVGIGLCRTEHMFFNPKRIHDVRKMIIAIQKEDKIKSINKLLKYQKQDFYDILKAISPFPATIRLLDPPLHEFLPHKKNHISSIAKDLQISVNMVKKRIGSLKELNPMLGHRGCRLGITFPELTIMQAKAIFEAYIKLKKEKINTKPEIMIPFVGSPEEFVHQKNLIDGVAKKINKKYGTTINYLVGTMIELPRACFVVDEIALHADFLSFGTNDLTQTTFGFSRDDIGSFLPYYLTNNILQNDPFESIDVDGVGVLIKMAVKKARNVNPKIKIGICGEHGGDPLSISFFNDLEFNYVSCSPFRVPIAYLSVAQNNC